MDERRLSLIVMHFCEDVYDIIFFCAFKWKSEQLIKKKTIIIQISAIPYI